MKLPATQALYAYWTAQCRGRCAPDRHDIDPVEMRGVLPHTFMLDVQGGERTYPIRLSGTRLDALFGRDMKGESFLELWTPDDRANISSLLDGVLDDAQPTLAGLRAAPNGYDATSFELLLLPLRHHGRTHARLLCGLVPTRTPLWLGLKPADRLDLVSWRSIDRAAEQATEQTRNGGLRRQHLVVFEGGRGSNPAVMPASQFRVKAAVPRSRDMVLSTRRS